MNCKVTSGGLVYWKIAARYRARKVFLPAKCFVILVDCIFETERTNVSI